MHNRLIERIRLRLVHTFVEWSNIGIFNPFIVLFFDDVFLEHVVRVREGVNLR